MNTAISMSERQAPLYLRYADDPEAARIEDYAITASTKTPASNPLRTDLALTHSQDTKLAVGVHEAVGGHGDLPTPGDILCGALAACLDSAIRIVANRLGVHIKHLEVQVSGEVDVRGTLRAKEDCPVAFQSIRTHVNVQAAPEVDETLIVQLLKAAEYSCVILQTLRSVPNTAISASINRAQDISIAH